jgi:thiamine kinase-like enzyme
LPQAKTDPELRRWLAAIPLLARQPAAAWQATPLAGLTNRSWRLTAGALDLVLRVPGPSSQRYLSRAQEQHNAALAAHLGIAPELLYTDPESGVTLQRFLADARPLTEDDFAVPAIARKIGTLLGRLHGASIEFKGAMAPFPIIDVYLALAADFRLRRLRTALEPVRQALERNLPKPVPSHIDPNPANFLLQPDGALTLIDWEFSAMCEPAWDLAAVSLEGGITPAAHAALMQGYGAPHAAVSEARLWLMGAALHLVAASWTHAEMAGGNAVPGLPALLETHLARLERKLADPDLGRRLAEAG